MACWSPPTESVDAYVSELNAFAQPVVEKLRAIITSAAPDLEEAIRWSAPSYKGKLLVCGFNAFQKHVALTFWQGSHLPDPKGLLQHGQGRTAMRTVKYTALDQVDEKMVRAWVKAAVAIDRGDILPPVKPVERTEFTVPISLAQALQTDNKARVAFEKLAPSHRREYCEWIAGAKQPATVQRRVDKALEKLAMGQGLNDNYRQ